MDITQTPLYKSLAAATRKSDHKRLARELQRAIDAVGESRGADKRRTDETSLGSAFVWASTPQGHAFWSEYCGNLSRNGWKEESGWRGNGPTPAHAAVATIRKLATSGYTAGDMADQAQIKMTPERAAEFMRPLGAYELFVSGIGGCIPKDTVKRLLMGILPA